MATCDTPAFPRPKPWDDFLDFSRLAAPREGWTFSVLRCRMRKNIKTFKGNHFQVITATILANLVLRVFSCWMLARLLTALSGSALIFFSLARPVFLENTIHRPKVEIVCDACDIEETVEFYTPPPVDDTSSNIRRRRTLRTR